jgi:hypothetical protein
MSVQYVAAASQKFTCPITTAADPDFTIAVSVTTLPESTVVTVLPADVIAKAVEVSAVAAQAFVATPPIMIQSPARRVATVSKPSSEEQFFRNGAFLTWWPSSPNMSKRYRDAFSTVGDWVFDVMCGGSPFNLPKV